MNDKEIMKTLKCNKRDLKVEYIRFSKDLEKIKQEIILILESEI